MSRAGLPRRVQIGPSWTVPVTVRRLPRELYGQWVLDDGEGEIFINASASRMQKHLTLFHELFHIAEEKLHFGGAIRRLSSEARVRNMAITLFGILATSGLWKGVSAAEGRRFYEQIVRQYEADRQRRRRVAARVRPAARSSRAKRRRAA